MDLFRVSGQLCDVHFTTAQHQQSLSAHRLVLAASSEYFRKLFKSKVGADGEICVKDVDDDILEMLINYCYTGVIDVNEENVHRLLRAATVLELHRVINSCTGFLHQQMTNDGSWLEVLKIADEVNMRGLREEALRHAVLNFMIISQKADFLDISAELLETIIENDELNVSSEQETFYAVKRWYEHDEDTRRQHLVKLMSTIRITQLDSSFILENIRPLPDCKELVLNALDWIHIPKYRCQTTLKHTKARQTLIAIPTTSEEASILQYDSEQDEWVANLTLIFPKILFDVVYTYRKQLIFFGGRTEDSVSKSDHSYNLITGKWQELPTMRKSRLGMCIVQLKKYIYLMGGQDENGSILNLVERYNIDTGDLCTMSSMQSLRCGAKAAIYNGKIYVMGGESHGGRYLRSVEYYDLEKDTWSSLANMHDARSLHAAAVAHNKIYVMGGGNKECSRLKTVECYDPLKNEWTTVRFLHEGRKQLSAVFFNNRLMVLGGLYRSDNLDVWTQTVEEYNFERNFWDKRKTLPFGDEFNCICIPTCVADKLKDTAIMKYN